MFLPTVYVWNVNKEEMFVLWCRREQLVWALSLRQVAVRFARLITEGATLASGHRILITHHL